ncbi:hypothetical protein BC826DRAFT_1036299 [Russula brevipes]|nr:hypothetical protein BC826DRAFT_1036299 [Russula brevipes]
MFRLPQPSDSEMLDGLPVVRLSEDAEVLNSLLTMLYPIAPVLPHDSYDMLLASLAASEKYDMANVQPRIRAEIQSRPFPTAAAAFRAYAISSRGGLPSVMESSARLTLNFPMTIECICDELPLFEGWALRDLIGFRKRCRDNLVSCFESLLKYDHPAFDIWISGRKDRHSCPKSTKSLGCKPSWLREVFADCRDSSRDGFAKPLFNPSAIRDKYLSRLQYHINLFTCLPCANVQILKGETFCKELENRLTLALSEVSTSFIFRTSSASLNICPD